MSSSGQQQADMMMMKDEDDKRLIMIYSYSVKDLRDLFYGDISTSYLLSTDQNKT